VRPTPTTQTTERPTNLIASDRVEGTSVYRLGGKRIGTIKRLMLDKKRGTVAYAVMSFGGFLGIGDDYYPLPWAMLTYDEALGGYQASVTDDQLRGAPKFVQDIGISATVFRKPNCSDIMATRSIDELPDQAAECSSVHPSDRDIRYRARLRRVGRWQSVRLSG
jgi:hypothetical protein